jgi:hypothetical protein
MCRNVQTFDRVSSVVQSGDKETAALLMQQLVTSGECSRTPPITPALCREAKSLLCTLRSHKTAMIRVLSVGCPT